MAGVIRGHFALKSRAAAAHMRSSVTHLENLASQNRSALSRRIKTPPTEWVVHAVSGGADGVRLI
jgi:hypothetical protein